MTCRNKPRKLSVIIPPTPVSTQAATEATANDDGYLYQHFSRHYDSPTTSPLEHPYRPRTAVRQEPEFDAIDIDLKAQEFASPDLLAVANLFISMKKTLTQMTRTFDVLGEQSQRMSSLAIEVKHAEEIRKVKTELEQQIARQESEVQKIRQRLEGEVRTAIEDMLRSKLSALIQRSVMRQVEERVRRELLIQVPQRLHGEIGLSGLNHTDTLLPGSVGELQPNSVFPQISFDGDTQAIEIPTFVIQEIGDRDHQSPPTPRPLRPLLRPLPTPEQSPAYTVEDSPSSRSTSGCPTPISAYPKVPAPTPITSSASTLMVPMRNSTGLLSPVPPTPSPLAPRDLNSLFALTSEKIRSLSWSYDLDGFALPSPVPEWPKARTVMKTPSSLWSEPLFVPQPISVNLNNMESNSEGRDLVLCAETPVLMIPPPRPQPRAGNSVTNNLKLLPPLIIN